MLWKKTITMNNQNVETDAPRMDKYLWTIRIFKTRNDAADACRSGKVVVNGQVVKPSKEVRVGELIEVRKGAVRYSYRVLSLLKHRVGAKDLAPYVLDETPANELAKGEMQRSSMTIRRDRGTGRPTKKERRDLAKVMDL
jgi:ribosome-associated heat shock protein Hsp15